MAAVKIGDDVVSHRCQRPRWSVSDRGDLVRSVRRCCCALMTKVSVKSGTASMAED